MICMKVVLIATCMAHALQALPTGCGEDAHCPSGFFCETSQRFCHECLRCEDLRRQQLLETTACITSVVECGDCLPGFLENIGGAGAGCVRPDAQGEGLALPSYGWALIVLALVLFAVMLCLVAAFVLRNFQTFKILASTRASVHSPVELVSSTSTTLATAPQRPPPYNIVSVPDHTDILDEESSWPFIKPVPATTPMDAVREPSFKQGAMVFNQPAYVHRPPLPPSYETEPIEALNTASEMQSIYEDAMDSANNNDISTIGSTTMSECVNGLPVAFAPPPKHQRVRQDSNNSSGSGEDGCSDSFPPFTNGSPLIINVIKNITAFQQQNDVSF